VNILSTLTGGHFDEWVKAQILCRNERVANKADKFIEVDPEIAAIFNNASSISLSKGTAHSMLQVGQKRRRTAKQKAKEDFDEQ